MTDSRIKHPQEEEIDLLELALKVWAERKWILKCCGYVSDWWDW
mgnify:CR=1 FL=1